MNDLNVISDAEWEIMRIIWEKAPVTSTQIIDALSSTKGWMPTTVKTFLSRLVTKEVIQFEKKGRTFYYTPLVTEEACVNEAIQNVISKVYGGGSLTTTEHFILKGRSDNPNITQLSLSLEKSYLRISEKLEQTLTQPVTVYLHSALSRLHSALGVLQGPSWLRAGHVWGIIHLAPADCFEDLSIEDAAAHVLALLLLEKINPFAPYWLLQDVAAYVTGWMSEERLKAVKKTLVNQQPFIQHRSAFLTFREQNGYEWATLTVDYIVNTYGMARLLNFIRNPHDYLSTFSVSEQQFWENWQNALTT